ncbi:MAG: cyclic nucleotide-binding domain-containing protein [Myxococcota bacterium]|jgi:CRP-like cAMP-binding protein
MNKADAIRACGIFSGYSGDLADQLAQYCTEREFEAGGEVFRAGTTGSSMFVVVTGMVRLVAATGDGHEELLGSLVPGEHFGGVSLLKSGRHLVTAHATEGTELLELPRQALIRLQKEKPQLAVKTMFAVVTDLVKMLRDNETFMLEALSGRIGERRGGDA